MNKNDKNKTNYKMEFLNIFFGGVGGVLITLCHNHFIAPEPTIIVNVNGVETEITSFEYAELVSENDNLRATVQQLKKQLELLSSNSTYDNEFKDTSKYLYELDTFSSTYDESLTEVFIQDWDTNIGKNNLGQTRLYYKAKEISCWGTSGTQIDTYILDCEYNTLEGYVFVPYEAKNYTNEQNYGYIEILDGETVLGKSPVVRGGIKPQEFNISINGASELTIKYYVNSQYLGYTTSPGFSFVVADLKLIP